jgi:hypothetical protein
MSMKWSLTFRVFGVKHRINVKVKVKLSLCFNWAPRHEGVLGSGGMVHAFLTSALVQFFTSWPLYPQGKSPWCPLDRRLCGSQSRSGRCGEKKNSELLPGLEPLIIQPSNAFLIFSFILHVPPIWFWTE